MFSHFTETRSCKGTRVPSRVGWLRRAMERAIAFVAPYCDIVERLALVPPAAQVRGVFFRNVITQLERSGRGRLAAYRDFFPNEKHSALAFYPISDFLIRMACAGALVTSPEKVHEGMFAICKSNAQAFIETMLGRMMLRMLSRDPVRLCEQGLAARRQSVTYGHWKIRRPAERVLEMVYENEYWWIESALAGAAQGTFEGCGIRATLETTLVDRFNGSTFVRW